MSEKLEICFITSHVDITVGTYRIIIKDLADYFTELGFRTYINELPKKINNNLVFILGKTFSKKIEDYKKKYPNNLIGIISPAGGTSSRADFIIVESLEEKDSLAKNKNVFLYPLVEKMYSKVIPKKHTDNNRVVIGMHGSFTHLSKFSPHLKKALEEFSKDVDIVLKIISNKNAKEWSYGRPKIPSIEFLDWDFEKTSKDLLSCDIDYLEIITDACFQYLKQQVLQKDYILQIIFFVLKINLMEEECLYLYNMGFLLLQTLPLATFTY